MVRGRDRHRTKSFKKHTYVDLKIYFHLSHVTVDSLFVCLVIKKKERKGKEYP